jgi:NAD(P)H-hydrate epimerase
MKKVVSAQEMRAVESAIMARGVTLQDLIETAGTAVANAADQAASGGKIVVLAGPGNNGNDGLVAAEVLRRGGRSVEVYGFRRAGPGIYEGALTNAETDPEMAALRGMLQGSSVVVDALLGIGQTRPPEGTLAAILEAARIAPSPRHIMLAVDVPTGVDADTGEVRGSAFQADVTLCMGYLKRGVILTPGKEYAGEARVVDLGVPPDVDATLAVSMPEAADIACLLPARSPDGNKGTYGRLLVIGGSRSFVGAPALVTNGAYRAGAGLVELAIPEPIQASVANHTIEAVYAPLPSEEGRLFPGSLDALESRFEAAAAAVLGPGMGASEATRDFTAQTLKAMDRALLKAAVVDADALSSLAGIPAWWDVRTPLVLTPHPGEMSRLTRRSIAAIQSDRIDTAIHYASRWQKVVVLKGAGTVVAAPDGRASINPTGAGNLATAGTGDVLSGIIGGLLAQGSSPWDAAVAGVYLHGVAGDILLAEHGDAGTIASDLFATIPAARLAVIRQAGAQT